LEAIRKSSLVVYIFIKHYNYQKAGNIFDENKSIHWQVITNNL